MDILDLKEKQADLTRQAQISHQGMIKRRLKQYGLDREKVSPVLMLDAAKLSKQIVTKALKLGMQWLESN